MLNGSDDFNKQKLHTLITAHRITNAFNVQLNRETAQKTSRMLHLFEI